jgi:uncharacterized membrane protein
MVLNATTNTSSIQEMDLADRFTRTLGDNETSVEPYTLAFSRTTGYNRVDFLLFNETVPALEVRGMDRINQSYRDLHLWVTVRSGSV